VKGTRFSILVLRAPFSWELPFGSGQAAAARLRIAGAFLRLLYGFRFHVEQSA